MCLEKETVTLVKQQLVSHSDQFFYELSERGLKERGHCGCPLGNSTCKDSAKQYTLVQWNRFHYELR